MPSGGFLTWPVSTESSWMGGALPESFGGLLAGSLTINTMQRATRLGNRRAFRNTLHRSSAPIRPNPRAARAVHKTDPSNVTVVTY